MSTPIPAIKTASSPLPVGARLAEFEITGVIGEGGFGIVYSAHDSSLERIVALKEYLPAAFAQRGSDGNVQVKSEEYRKTFAAGLSSFINEARMLAKFSHPGLVEVFRFWEANGTAYMAMRYYRGVTLRETLRSSRAMITEQWLCETLDPILLALRELHNERCFHRDIAPDNIMVLPNGRSVLMDFGAARRIISGMTQALTTVLKPGYAPIEQYYDDGSMPQGAWTDIYAVGGLLYHLMSGKVPVQAISRMMSDPLKPVAEISSDVFSERLCNVVMKCLAVLPESRYQSIDELRAALGWVTLPVVSTLIHQPAVKASIDLDFQETVLMAPADLELRSFTQAELLSQPVRETAALYRGAQHSGSLTSQTSINKSVGNGSIDGLLVPSDPVPKDLSVEPQKPAARTSDAAARTDHKKNAAGLMIGLITVVVILAGGSLYLSGFFGVDSAGKQASVQVPIAAGVQQAAPAVTPAANGVSEPIPNAVNPDAAASLPTTAEAQVGGEVIETKAGSLKIELVGGWGNVIVDGELKGIVPPVLVINLPAGTHDLEIQNPAANTERRKVTVSPGKTVVVRHVFPK